MNKIDFVIAVKNRSNSRIQRCINSIKSDITNKIYVVDYGSDKPIKVKSAKVINYKGSKIWNKSHALNLGIKKCNSNYICTIDCDIILDKKHFEKIKICLDKNVSIFNTNVRRIKVKDISKNYSEMIKKSFPWFEDNPRSNIYSGANGGIQIFPKEWIYKIGGYDEGLGLYWGAMDNRIYEQAKMDGLTIIDLNLPMLHQEHKLKKEQNLSKDERKFANNVRLFKINYIRELVDKNIIISDRPWGCRKPNHDWIINKVKEWEKDLIPHAKIYVSIVTNYDSLPTYFVLNLIKMVEYAKSYGIIVDIFNPHGSAVDMIRNVSVIDSLNKGYTHLLQLDTDHIYPEDTILRLLSHKKDFVCGITNRRNMPYTQTQFKDCNNEKVNTPGNICEFKGDEGLVKIGATGMVGSLIKLKVLKRINFPFYDRVYFIDNNGRALETGEDIYFCRKLNKEGIDLWCDTSLSYPHNISNAFVDKGKVVIQI